MLLAMVFPCIRIKMGIFQLNCESGSFEFLENGKTIHSDYESWKCISFCHMLMLNWFSFCFLNKEPKSLNFWFSEKATKIRTIFKLWFDTIKYYKLSVKRPVLLNDLVWIFPKTLSNDQYYLNFMSSYKKSSCLY